MNHRHSGKYRSRTPRGRVVYKRMPLHVQTLIFPKNKYTRKKALKWAKDHGFKHYTSREEDNTIRVRQFPPSEVTRYGGTFSMGSNIQGLYADRRTKRTIRRFEPREQERHLDTIQQLTREIIPLRENLTEMSKNIDLTEEQIELENKIFDKEQAIKEEQEFLE